MLVCLFFFTNKTELQFLQTNVGISETRKWEKIRHDKPYYEMKALLEQPAIRHQTREQYITGRKVRKRKEDEGKDKQERTKKNKEGRRRE